MPNPILKSILRTFFLNEGLNSFFDKAIPALNPYTGLVLYEGDIRVGMYFKRVEFNGSGFTKRNHEIYEDVRITCIRKASEGLAADFTCKRHRLNPHKRETTIRSAAYLHFLTFYV